MVAKIEFDPDDARLSAYALGELDESERAAVEELLARDPNALAFVEGLRETVEALQRGFAAESTAELSDSQRAGVMSAAGARALPRRSWWRYAVAAGVAITAAGGSIAVWRGGVSSGSVDMATVEREVARGMPNSTAAPTAPDGSTLDQLPSLGYAWGDGGVTVTASSAQPVGMPSAVSERTAGAEVVSVGRTSPRPELSARTRYGYVSSGQDASNDVRARTENYFERVTDGEELDRGRFDTEAYDALVENPFRLSREEPLSTFSIDVDTASYANVRRFLMGGQKPPAGAVRIEELINYFDYDYPQPTDGVPFSVTTDVASCPWNARHQLVRIGLKGREVLRNERNASNLVFLIDVSGSMNAADKLPLVKQALSMLTTELDARDQVAIVVYAGASGLVLDSTSARNRGVVLDALERLGAGGSTNGGEGIQLAYKVAREHFVDGGTNRVILCTDGDFNVGTTSQDELVRLIEEKRRSGVFLSVLGFGTGNLKDSTMEKLADKGNGNYAYIDGPREARKVLVEEIGGTLETIAKDVKIQIEFNPAEVQAWRLVGYENRVLAHQDFNDDTKDAGEIGAGHTVTALYELVPQGVPFTAPEVDALRYQEPSREAASSFSGEMAFVKLRYKEPTSDTSKLLAQPIRAQSLEWQSASYDFRFAAAVAAFAMKLRASQHTADLDWATIESLAANSLGRDARGYRVEFVDLVRRAAQL